MQSLIRAWNGQEPLWKVFWLYTVAPLFAAFLLGGLIAKADAGNQALTVQHLFWLKLGIFPYAVFTAYLVFQCLHNIVESAIYARAAMACCLFWTLWLLQSLSHGPHLPPPPPPRMPLIVQRPYYSPTGDFLATPQEAEANSKCVRKMNDYALTHRVNPQKYISENEVYLRKCTEYLMKSNRSPDKQ